MKVHVTVETPLQEPHTLTDQARQRLDHEAHRHHNNVYGLRQRPVAYWHKMKTLLSSRTMKSIYERSYTPATRYPHHSLAP